MPLDPEHAPAARHDIARRRPRTRPGARRSWRSRCGSRDTKNPRSRGRGFSIEAVVSLDTPGSAFALSGFAGGVGAAFAAAGAAATTGAVGLRLQLVEPGRHVGEASRRPRGRCARRACRAARSGPSPASRPAGRAGPPRRRRRACSPRAALISASTFFRLANSSRERFASRESSRVVMPSSRCASARVCASSARATRQAWTCAAAAAAPTSTTPARLAAAARRPQSRGALAGRASRSAWKVAARARNASSCAGGTGAASAPCPTRAGSASLSLAAGGARRPRPGSRFRNAPLRSWL